MSKLLEPFSDFLRSLGVDPLDFAILGMVLLIYFSRKNYKNWSKNEKNQNTILKLYIAGLVLMIFMKVVFYFE
ncbi:MAG: hypothetical protein JJ882_15210 [Balneola sp.]|nr:hypothetical protein [Balneola sp.]MBO6871960.1 hypothetical protein [Balneola sp.]